MEKVSPLQHSIEKGEYKKNTLSDILAISEEGKLEADPNTRDKRIRNLKKEIEMVIKAKARVDQFQNTYNIPKEGLTENDITIIDRNIEPLQAELAHLEENRKQQSSPLKNTFRKIAAFLASRHSLSKI